jgi:hypothetical protein
MRGANRDIAVTKRLVADNGNGLRLRHAKRDCLRRGDRRSDHRCARLCGHRCDVADVVGVRMTDEDHIGLPDLGDGETKRRGPGGTLIEGIHDDAAATRATPAEDLRATHIGVNSHAPMSR